VYSVKTKEEFESDVRAIDETLKNIRLTGININRSERSIRYEFICDKTVDQDLKLKILKEAEKITSPIFSLVEISVRKIKNDDELVNNEIYKYLQKHHMSVSVFLKPTDIRSEVFGDVVKYTVRLSPSACEQVRANGILGALNTYLSGKFCADFIGATEEKEPEETVDILSNDVFESELERVNHRTIKVKSVEVIDDFSMGDLALYIEDFNEGDAVICGKITDITEKLTRPKSETEGGKPYFIINLDDTTGRTSGVYFSKKKTLDRIRRLKAGDSIIARASVGEYNGRRSTTFERINACEFPEDFVKKEKFKKSAPKEYKTVFPSPSNVIKVSSVFDEKAELPAELLNKEYVVFDIETTGLNDQKDEITEIGAVRIKNGKITEQFTSLIKINGHVPLEIVGITGISDDMLINSPRISAVIPDFLKFIEGATLVGHNVGFDIKFVKRFAAAEDYYISNPIMDTMELSRQYLPQLKRNDLHTVADYFSVVFHHHRALSDAYATAEVFIELMKIKAKKGS